MSFTYFAGDGIHFAMMIFDQPKSHNIKVFFVKKKKIKHSNVPNSDGAF